MQLRCCLTHGRRLPNLKMLLEVEVKRENCSTETHTRTTPNEEPTSTESRLEPRAATRSSTLAHVPQVAYRMYHTNVRERERARTGEGVGECERTRANVFNECTRQETEQELELLLKLRAVS